MSENYYDVLGISKDCTQDDIKKAYRKLSFKYHPDKNKSQEAVKQFQKLADAYGTLSDVSKRKNYDLTQNHPFLNMQSGYSAMEVPLYELFASLFGGIPPDRQHGRPRGGLTSQNVHVFHAGGNPFMNMSQAMEKPTPIISNITIPISNILSSSSVPLEIERWVMENGNKTFEKENLRFLTIE